MQPKQNKINNDIHFEKKKIIDHYLDIIVSRMYTLYFGNFFQTIFIYFI